MASGTARPRSSSPATAKSWSPASSTPPAELVFDALTKPEHVRMWFGVKELEVCEIDFRAGGKYHFATRDSTWAAADGVHADEGGQVPLDRRGLPRRGQGGMRLLFTPSGKGG
jgi:hypothetical protein